jgi:hypothetical protein
MIYGFALEYCLGHITHADNLIANVANMPDVSARYLKVPFDQTPLAKSLCSFPLFKKNWSVYCSLVAALGMRAWIDDADAAFFIFRRFHVEGAEHYLLGCNSGAA